MKALISDIKRFAVHDGGWHPNNGIFLGIVGAVTHIENMLSAAQ